jgi:hypothetical protein
MWYVVFHVFRRRYVSFDEYLSSTGRSLLLLLSILREICHYRIIDLSVDLVGMPSVPLKEIFVLIHNTVLLSVFLKYSIKKFFYVK